MNTTLVTQSDWTSPVWSEVSRCVRLAFLAFVGSFWFLSADGAAWRAVLFGAAFGLTALAARTWHVRLARASACADRRWRTALDHYAQKEWDRFNQQEQVRRTHAKERLR
jgi:hypothetical protein